MRIITIAHPAWRMPLLLACILLATSGCSRTKYRLQADREAYDVIAERNKDPRWAVPAGSIEMDPRSRYFDEHDPDRPPMPLDDPDSHKYMHSVNGMEGWEKWHENGDRVGYENLGWRDQLAEYVDISEDGSIQLDVDSALRLAYIHSPSHQDQLETLYLSSLDVTAERFRLDTQFFGGYDAIYSHNGSLIPAGLTTPPSAGGESNRLSLGHPSVFQASRRYATAAELLVGFANSFVFEFTGSDANLAASLANFSLVQPLLRGAGKEIALEQLTNVERTLLANVRSYRQYRQGFYTQIAIGELGVSGPRRGGSSTSFSGSFGGGVGGYIGLLQQLQRIRNTEDNLSLQLRTLAQLEALLDVGVIDLVQVDQFRQSVESERSNLLQNRNSLELSLDSYKTSTLGLSPDLPIQLDDSLIQQFQLVARTATAVQDTIVGLQDRVGELPEDATVEVIGDVLSSAGMLVEPIRQQLGEVQNDLTTMEQSVPVREKTMTEADRELFQEDREQLVNTLADLEERFLEVASDIETLQGELSEQTRPASVTGLVVWLGDALRLIQRSVLVQARARLERITVEAIGLESPVAFEIALANRLDVMNARAALVDRWRSIEISANALQSVVNITASGDIKTARNNPVSFRAPTGSFRLGMEFDAPFTRLLERNAYRESLISYQQSRRSFIQSRDSVHLGLRQLLRQIEQLRTDLEIQRRAVAIAIRRVDLTRAQLYAPVTPPQPGQPVAPFGPTAAQNLIQSLSSLRNTQNTFMSVWLSYYATRMRLSRELGVMTVDQDGIWIDEPIPDTNDTGPGEEDPGAAPQ
jgi:hypothetical protein